MGYILSFRECKTSRANTHSLHYHLKTESVICHYHPLTCEPLPKVKIHAHNLILLPFTPLLWQDPSDVLLQAVEIDAGEQLGESGHLRLSCRARKLRVLRRMVS